MKLAAFALLVGLVAGFETGACVGRAERREETLRAIREADQSHAREGECFGILSRTRAGLGLLQPSKGGVGGGP